MLPNNCFSLFSPQESSRAGMGPRNDDNSLYQYRNCRIIKNGQLLKEDLWVRNGKIMNPEFLFFVEKVKADVQIDCNNHIISPGFIDIQINGKQMLYKVSAYFN